MFKTPPSEQWCLRAANAEGDADIHAGPKMEKPMDKWVLTSIYKERCPTFRLNNYAERSEDLVAYWSSSGSLQVFKNHELTVDASGFYSSEKAREHLDAFYTNL